MRKAALAVGLIGCLVVFDLAMSAPDEGTGNPAVQSKEPKDQNAKQDDGKQPGEPDPQAKKPSPFGSTPKMAVGKQLLETNRKFVKAWKVDDLLNKVEGGFSNRDFDRGKKLYSEAKCVLCHTYGQDQGGFIGPALTDVGARFSAVDILYSIIEPNKIIADAYQQRIVELVDGRVLTGMVAQPDADVYITPDILDPDRQIIVNEDKVASMKTSAVSPMPEGLINVLNEEEIFDLIAYVISRNDREDEMFAPVAKNK